MVVLEGYGNQGINYKNKEMGLNKEILL